MKTQYKDNKKKIFAPLRDKWLEAKPEEVVRQDFICKLVNDYGYSLEQMTQEPNLTQSRRGAGRASADIVVWKTAEEKKLKKATFLVVELKAYNLKLKVEDCYQGYNYATWSRAKVFAISNSKELQVFKVVEDEIPLNLDPVNDIPNALTILDSAKLTKALAETKEFTGDEFAKLLHKCHNIIRNNDKLSPEASFDEISKILFIKIMYDRSADKGKIFSLKEFNRLKNNHKELTKGTNEEGSSFIQARFEQVKNRFKDDGIFDDNEKIKIRESSFEAIVKELQIYNLTSTSADVKGIAFERFLGRTFRGELGQFFTPRTIVDFIVDLLQPQENELICDPCAGSGGFLIKVFEIITDVINQEYQKLKIEKREDIFGKFKKLNETEEKALSGEKLANYKKDETVFIEKMNNTDLQNQYETFLTKTNKEQEVKIAKLSHQSIFGTDANPRMARVSKMNMIMHGDGHNGIHHNDGLLNINGIFRDRFDVIITNPPFGTNLSKTSPTVEEDDRYTNEAKIADYTDKYGKCYQQEMQQVTDNIGKSIRGLFEVGKTSGATEILFIERCLDLLKAGGRMGIVLPEGVLNSSTLQKARDYFESRAKILLIVSLPQDVFISSGATVKTSVVFFKKFTKQEKAQYEQIKNKATVIIKDKYADELVEITEKLILRGNQALDKAAKIQLRKDEKTLKQKIQVEIKTIIKQEFNYEIPIADIKQAGITTTGTKGDSQLPDLLTTFAKYRKQNNLW